MYSEFELEFIMRCKECLISKELIERGLKILREVIPEDYRPEHDIFISNFINYAHEDVRLIDYFEQNLSTEQMKQIAEELKANKDENLDNSKILKICCDKNYDQYQRQTLLLAMNANIDVTPLIEQDFDYEQMYQIAYGLCYGLDITEYNNPDLDAMEMKKIIVKQEYNYIIEVDEDESLNFDLVEEIEKGLIVGVDVSKYDHTTYMDYSTAEISLIREYLVKGVDITPYIIKYNKQKAIEIAEGLLK